MIYRRAINLGLAVDLGKEGLIVPVLKAADEKSLRGLARAVNDLAERARARALAPDEVQGGTFSLTNHGVIGSLAATPIIPLPQVGILGVGAIQRRPVVVDTQSGEAIAIRPMVYLSLSFDHRAVDGATADRFMATIKAYLETYGVPGGERV
jgi:2-oxoglutarate dehydrogenase E2 component (dihydrolipoamide succinyltransferase)